MVVVKDDGVILKVPEPAQNERSWFLRDLAGRAAYYSRLGIRLGFETDAWIEWRKPEYGIVSDLSEAVGGVLGGAVMFRTNRT